MSDWLENISIQKVPRQCFVVGPRKEIPNHLYRFADIGSTIHTIQYPITKRTPHGCWIRDYGQQRWVHGSAKKRYAYPTLDEAWESYKIRKTRQLQHLNRQLKNCQLINKRLESDWNGLD